MNARAGDGSLPARSPDKFGQCYGRLAPARSYRDLFPLPQVVVPARRLHRSRRGSQLVLRTRARAQKLNEVVRSLNWMHDPLGTETPIWDYEPGGWTLGGSMHGDVLARLDGLIGKQQPGPNAPSPQAAFEKLLHGQSPYDSKGPPVSLASFRMDRLSLPSSVHDCPEVGSVLPGDALVNLSEYQERMLAGGALAAEVKTKVFFDPVLRYNQKKYQALIRMLIERGLVQCVEKAEESIGLFCVKKSDGTKLRLIVDARRSNERFGTPPGVSLITGEGFANFEVEFEDTEDQEHNKSTHYANEGVFAKAGEEEMSEKGPDEKELAEVLGGMLYLGSADVRDCFHRLKTPPWMWPYFCLPAVPAQCVGMVGRRLGDRTLQVGDAVIPAWSVLPMGFTWSLYYAQKANEHLAERSLQGAAQRLFDRGPPLVLGRCSGTERA